MKSPINEITRMQLLAGILNEEQATQSEPKSVEDLANILDKVTAEKGKGNALVTAHTLGKNKTAVWLSDPRAQQDGYIINVLTNNQDLFNKVYNRKLNPEYIQHTIKLGNEDSRVGSAYTKEKLYDLIKNHDRVFFMSKYGNKVIELTK